MKKYLYIVKTQIIKSMTYEFNVYGNIIMQTIIMITSAYFWRALYKGRGMVGGVNADSMLTYVVISSALSVLLITNVERRIQMSVIKGTVATDMMKPINVFGVYFAEDIGNIIALVFQNMLPILVIGSGGRPRPAAFHSVSSRIFSDQLADCRPVRHDRVLGGQYRRADSG